MVLIPTVRNQIQICLTCQSWILTLSRKLKSTMIARWVWKTPRANYLARSHQCSAQRGVYCWLMDCSQLFWWNSADYATNLHKPLSWRGEFERVWREEFQSVLGIGRWSLRSLLSKTTLGFGLCLPKSLEPGSRSCCHWVLSVACVLAQWALSCNGKGQKFLRAGLGSCIKGRNYIINWFMLILGV